MLIGSSDSDGSNSSRTITLHHNYFLNCGQRLPMVRNSKLHVFNNYYDTSSPYYTQQYCIGVRKGSLIIAEGNYFGSGIQYSARESYGSLYFSGNTDKSKGQKNTKPVSSKPFSVPYGYTVESSSNVPNTVKGNAGAGQSFSK